MTTSHDHSPRTNLRRFRLGVSRIIDSPVLLPSYLVAMTVYGSGVLLTHLAR